MSYFGMTVPGARRSPPQIAWSLAWAGILSLAFCTSATSAQLDIQHWETSNGAQVYFVAAMELPMVDIQVVYDAGSARDAAGRAGLAKLTSRLLSEGTGELDADAIAERFEGVGARFSTESHRDMAVVNLRSLNDPALFDPALDLMAAILRAPTFPAESLERERNRMLTSLQRSEQSPGDIASRTFYREIYGEHPYARHPDGTRDSLRALTREDVEDHHQRYYVARNAVIAIVGALSRAEAEEVAEQLTRELPAGEAAPDLPPAPRLEGPQDIHVNFPAAQMHIQAGQPGIKRHDPDYFPLYVGNHILGGGGLVSRISTEIREKRGLAYSSYSYFSPMRVEGPFVLGLQTRADQAGDALEILYDTVESFIDEGPTEEELTASKKNITGGFPLRIASNSAIAGNLAVIGFYGLPLDYLDTFNDHVEAVTLDDVRDAFKRRVQPDAMVTVTVGRSAQ